MLLGMINEDPQGADAAAILLMNPFTYFLNGGNEACAHLLLIKFGPKFFLHSFEKLMHGLIKSRCSKAPLVVLSWARRDEFIKEKRDLLSCVIRWGYHEYLRSLVDSGVDFYAVIKTIPDDVVIPRRKRLEQTVMRRTHCKMTVMALLAVRRAGCMRNQDRFIIQKIALAIWTTRWSFDWNRARHPRPQFADRFFEKPI